jgi:hypothetical protein
VNQIKPITVAVSLFLTLLSPSPQNALHSPINTAASVAGTTCFVSDQENIVYDDGYASAQFGPFNVGAPGDWHQANADIRAWRFTSPSNHWCYRGYYASAWITDGVTRANINASLRVWACGQFAGSMVATSDGNDWRASTTRVNWNGAMGSVVDIWVSDVYPSGATVEFYAYGTAPCGRQMDNFYTSACKSSWAQCFGPVVNGGVGYLNEGNF